MSDKTYLSNYEQFELRVCKIKHIYSLYLYKKCLNFFILNINMYLLHK